jgi:hypothetical protein
MKPQLVSFHNKMQQGQYWKTEPFGQISDRPDFTPYYSPAEMLQYGVFEGCYLNSCKDEYPMNWFARSKLSDTPDSALNLFHIKSRLPTSWWMEKGLINPQDPRGWFEWYCRFYMGRRSEDDSRQIKRHRAFARHSAQVLKHGGGNALIRPKQRQALLQWSWNAFPDFKQSTPQQQQEVFIA